MKHCDRRGRPSLFPNRDMPGGAAPRPRNPLELGSWNSEAIGYNGNVRPIDVSETPPDRFSAPLRFAAASHDPGGVLSITEGLHRAEIALMSS